mgnify:FL=1
MLYIREVGGDVFFKVRVMPRSSRDSVVGIHEDALKIRLSAPPLEGRANEACRAFLSKKLGVPRAQVEIHTGETSRNKVVKVSGLSSEKVLKALLP